MANAIMVLFPYKRNGVWMFDDEATGLKCEPFVLGMGEIFDKATAAVPNAENGFKLFFSGNSFPGATVTLQWRRAESGGNWYFCTEFNMEGWLCPALFKYFETAPQTLYGKAEPLVMPLNEHRQG